MVADQPFMPSHYSSVAHRHSSGPVAFIRRHRHAIAGAAGVARGIHNAYHRFTGRDAVGDILQEGNRRLQNYLDPIPEDFTDRAVSRVRGRDALEERIIRAAKKPRTTPENLRSPRTALTALRFPGAASQASPGSSYLHRLARRMLLMPHHRRKTYLQKGCNMGNAAHKKACRSLLKG